MKTAMAMTSMVTVAQSRGSTAAARSWRVISRRGRASTCPVMAVLVSGAAGFIGYHVAEALIARGERVVGFDSVNAYYDPGLKEARLARLARHHNSFRL